MNRTIRNLKGAVLATAYAAAMAVKLGQARHKVWAHYAGGGWITLRGEGLKPHPDLAATYPNGWSLLDRVRSGKARAVVEATK